MVGGIVLTGQEQPPLNTDIYMLRVNGLWWELLGTHLDDSGALTDSKPSPRKYHSMWLSEDGSGMYLWGGVCEVPSDEAAEAGRGPTARQSDMWFFNLTSPEEKKQWTRVDDFSLGFGREPLLPLTYPQMLTDWKNALTNQLMVSCRHHQNKGKRPDQGHGTADAVVMDQPDIDNCNQPTPPTTPADTPASSLDTNSNTSCPLSARELQEALLLPEDVVEVVVEGFPLFLSKQLLVNASPFFHTMFQSSFRETLNQQVELKGLRLPTFLLILHYMYCGDLDLTLLEDIEDKSVWSSVDDYTLAVHSPNTPASPISPRSKGHRRPHSVSPQVLLADAPSTEEFRARTPVAVRTAHNNNTARSDTPTSTRTTGSGGWKTPSKGRRTPRRRSPAIGSAGSSGSSSGSSGGGGLMKHLFGKIKNKIRPPRPPSPPYSSISPFKKHRALKDASRQSQVHEAMMLVLERAMAHGSCKSQLCTPLEVILGAEMLGLDSLGNIVQLGLSKLITSESVIDLLLFSVRHHCDILTRSCIMHIILYEDVDSTVESLPPPLQKTIMKSYADLTRVEPSMSGVEASLRAHGLALDVVANPQGP